MCKQWVLLISILVCGLAGSALAEDPNLVGYWKFDGDPGDYSGQGNDGTLMGDATYSSDTPLETGMSLYLPDLTGPDDYVDLGNPDILNFGKNDWTIAAWIKTTQDIAVNTGNIFSNGGEGSEEKDLYVLAAGEASDTSITLTTYDSISQHQAVGFSDVNDGEWHHVVGLREGSWLRVYVDGIQEGMTSLASPEYNLSGTDQANAYIGIGWDYASSELIKQFSGYIDDVRVYNRALSDAEIRELPGVDVYIATYPNPVDGAEYVAPDANLSWTPGEFAAEHKVYFGTTSPPPYVATLPLAQTTYDPGPLQVGRTYYWRIDEVNDPCVWEGDIWSFTVNYPPYPINGDFETGVMDPWYLISGTVDGVKPSNEFGKAAPFGGNYKCGSACHGGAKDGTIGQVIPAQGEGLMEIKVSGWVYTWITGGSTINNAIRFGIEQPVGNLIWQSPPMMDNDGEWHYYEYTLDPAVTGLVADEEFQVHVWFHQVWGNEPGELWHVTFVDNMKVDILRIIPPGVARDPNPADGATDVSVDVVVDWTPGIYAAEHDVYFGKTDPPPFIQTQAAEVNSFDPCGVDDLELGTTYYWKIDEVNEACDPCLWPGEVWSFTTANWLLVDDFEDYTSHADLRDTWEEGGNALVYLETTIVHGGGQSMHIDYLGNSEATRTFDTAQDWTAKGIKALVLWFRGAAGNGDERLYVALEDATGTRVEVEHPDPNLQDESWQEWGIALQDFADGGVDLTAIKKISIGLGGGAGGSGDMYFDDVRLYPSRCLAQYAPQGDVDGDCDVDREDLDMLTDFWLESEPDPARCRVHWAFEEGGGTVAVDDSGNNNDGVISGNPQWVDGVIGSALAFDGVDDAVDRLAANNIPNDVNEPFSMNVWVYYIPVVPSEYWTPIATIGDLPTWSGSSRSLTNISTIDFWCQHQTLYSGDFFWVKVWQMVTVTFDGTTVRIYRNAEEIAQKDMIIPPTASEVHLAAIGPNGAKFTGRLDEFTVWDGVLTEDEINYLYLGGLGADLSDDGKVNFEDYAILAEDWLKGPILWP